MRLPLKRKQVPSTGNCAREVSGFPLGVRRSAGVHPLVPLASLSVLEPSSFFPGFGLLVNLYCSIECCRHACIRAVVSHESTGENSWHSPPLPVGFLGILLSSRGTFCW